MSGAPGPAGQDPPRAEETPRTYVYAVVLAGHPLGQPPPLGVGDRPVRAVAEGELAAVVSDAPEGLRTKRRHLLAHQRVITGLGAAGPVLPLRFGSLSPHDDAVRAVLAHQAEHYLERLRELTDRVEFNVKASHREEVLLRGIATRDTRIRELNLRTRGGGPEVRQDRLLLGELLARAVRAQAARDSESVVAALRPLSRDDAPGPPVGGCVCNHSFLVDRSSADAFHHAVEHLEQENDHLRLDLHGPLPPYSFVEPAAQRQPV